MIENKLKPILQKSYMFLKRKVMLSLAISFFFILFVWSAFQLDRTKLIEFEPVPSYVNDSYYSIMLDAGSTGSRIHIYKFLKKSDVPILIKEVFEQVRPGLSSYSKSPKEGAESIDKLLSIAKNEIPFNCWSKTKVALRATAGLRLLPSNEAQNLLVEVKKVFKSSTFLVLDNSVAIMDGIDEGIFGWITTNYLLNRLTSLNSQFSVGTIDLGGGSMQITFAPHNMETITDSPPDFIVNASVFGNQIKLYSHSYLGLGLMSARENVLQDSTLENSSFATPCMPAGYHGYWKNGQKNYLIHGTGNVKNHYEACRMAVRKSLGDTFHQPLEVKHRTFYVFSYFFDRAVDMKLIDREIGGTLTVQSYISGAERACSGSNFDESYAFLCMDLTLLASYLEDGCGFYPSKKLYSAQKINQKETSWTLGATFSLFQ